MPKLFNTAEPHEVHQLLVSVSKHYLVGATGKIRYQNKTMDVSLRNYHKSDREHLVYYVLRDRFSGFYYVEVYTTKTLIPLQDFLFRSFLPKPDIYFGGIPKVLMVPKDVDKEFEPIYDLLNGLKITKVDPPSGFDSGIAAIKDWEKTMKVPLIPEYGLDEIKYWTPRTGAYFLNIYNKKLHKVWEKSIPNQLFMPDNKFVEQFASPQFKKAEDFALYLPQWAHTNIK